MLGVPLSARADSPDFNSRLSRVLTKVRGAKFSRINDLSRRTANRRELAALAEIGRTSGEAALSEKCLVGTFHKVGTVLMSTVLSDFSSAAGLGMWRDGASEPAEQWHICRHNHSDFESLGLDPAKHPTVVILRDPRDVIISAMKYHKKSSEAWLHRKESIYDDLDGMTYQEKINSLPDDRTRLIWEFKHSGGRVTSKMLACVDSPAHANTLFVKLEDLMADRTLSPFDRIFRHLGVRPAWMPLALTAAYKRSLFNPDAHVSKAHVTSGRTEVWRKTYDDELTAAFKEAFPNAVERLGYSW
ncbi:hypothetical protein [Pelagovum pacificum]|uniref:Sulfotransferase domain-containing protein n=1 Tax=Pelagovum pacificum TaxID=2588711 RepID=A0A5C5G874_9RHOB|nr:hypothetical protein [Pelagovum pacificum]QQA41807.1 hypothetical protein I8N54_13475 [Pelagovum pacificum]TNY30751.1 hypothetical protein FHY64_19455 [Pelagovum pacificum]